MHTKITNYIIIFSIIFAFLIGFTLYSQLPDQMAVHWNMQGEVDDYTSKFWGIIIVPFTMIFLALLYFFIPRIDPLRGNIEAFRTSYNAFMTCVILFLLYLFCLMMIWNTGYRFNFSLFVLPAFALFMYVMGDMLSRSKRNWFIGIRTPWTLSSDMVWKKTHEVGGKSFKILSVFLLLFLLFPKTSYLIFMLVSLFLIILFLAVYSYFLYKREQKKR